MMMKKNIALSLSQQPAMIIKSLSVKNFRNIRSAQFDFSSEVNIFNGNNAQGKTNLMEAISLCLGKSFRGAKAAEIVPFERSESTAENDNLSIVASKTKDVVDFSVGEPANDDNNDLNFLQDNLSKNDIKPELKMQIFMDNLPEKINELRLTKQGNRFSTTCNNIAMKDAESLYGALRYVVFTPDDLYLIKGSPILRRDYIDFATDMMNRVHHIKAADYRRSLKQKSNLLAKIDVPASDDLAMIEVWNENIARLGVNMHCARLKYFKILSELAAKIYAQLNDNNEILTMKYESSVFKEQDTSLLSPEELYNLYYFRLNSHMKEEFILKRTLVGVHKDDITFFINGKNARQYASQGQIRSITLSLKLAEAQMYTGKSGDKPIVILDDVLSELDEFRRNFVINYVGGFQIFITGCNIFELERFKGKIWNVSQGNFSLE